MCLGTVYLVECSNTTSIPDARPLVALYSSLTGLRARLALSPKTLASASTLCTPKFCTLSLCQSVLPYPIDFPLEPSCFAHAAEASNHAP